MNRHFYLFASLLLSLAALATSCDKDEDLMTYYGDSKKSYVKSCDKSVKVELDKCVRDGSNVNLTYNIWTTRSGDTYASMSTGPWDGSASKVGSDDTGRTYTNGYPHGYSNIEIYISGKQVGTYGWGQQFTLSKDFISGRVVFHLVSNEATTVTVKLPVTSNTPNFNFDKDCIEFVNIPIKELQVK